MIWSIFNGITSKFGFKRKILKAPTRIFSAYFGPPKQTGPGTHVPSDYSYQATAYIVVSFELHIIRLLLLSLLYHIDNTIILLF